MRAAVAIVAALVAAGLGCDARRDAATTPHQRDAGVLPGAPAPDAPLPRDPEALAAALADTTRALRREVETWRDSGEDEPPAAVEHLALHQARICRRLAGDRRLARATLSRLPRGVAGEVRDIVLARRHLAAIPHSGGRRPRIRVGPAPSPAALLRHYRAAERRFGVPWHVLASVNFVESAFGRLRNESTAGARGPMQFMPATWNAYGMGGDVRDPRDAIMGAANYLRASGALGRLQRALFAYNRSEHYVAGVLRLARRMRRDPRVFYVYWSWPVYVRGPHGPRRVTGPGRPARP